MKKLEKYAEDASDMYAEEIYHITGKADLAEFAKEDFFMGFCQGAEDAEKRLDAVRNTVQSLIDIGNQHKETYSVSIATYLKELLK